MVSNAIREISSISDLTQNLKALSDKIGDVYYELQDVSETVRSYIDDDGFSSAELEAVESRINLIYNLSKKYGETEEDILTYLENAKKELEEISFSDEKLEELKIQYAEAEEKALALATELSALRKKTAEIFSQSVCNELKYLDMPHIEFVVDFKPVDLCEKGIDYAEFLISANIGEIPKPITKIASGGELSRIMLALKTIMADKDKIETLIFDEIDTGVSGRAAVKVASKLRQVSGNKQVICVTHLAQIASQGDVHLFISKSVRDSKTYTEVSVLLDEKRVYEIARIMGGIEITDLQLQSAREMLEKAGNL
jgi:DNA repair protein RecN (Recombination protein N)